MAKRKPHIKSKIEKKNYMTIVFLAFIVIGLSSSAIFFGFGSGEGSGTVRYEGLKFTYKGEFWSAKINGVETAFTYRPDDVHIIPLEGDATLLQSKLQIDTTSDLNDTLRESIGLAQYQMGLTLSNHQVFLRGGFLKNNSLDAPIITCSDATPLVPVVIFESSNETRVDIQGYCATVKATTHTNMIRAKDRLLYSVFGVM